MKTLALALTLAAALALAGCDQIKDAVHNATQQDFDQGVKLELPAVVLNDQGGTAAASVQCSSTSVDSALVQAGVDTANLTIDSADLQYLDLRYRNATWTPSSIETVDCSITLGDGEHDATVASFAVDQANDDWRRVDLSAQAAETIGYFLIHRGASFDYCAQCSDEPTTLHAEFDLDVGIEVRGKLSVF